MLIDELLVVVHVFRHLQRSLVVKMRLQISEVNAVGLTLLTDNREAVVDALQLACIDILIERIARYKQDV